ncbi:MAG: dihydrolipoyl dehydrogenase [Athalassotoga sp.]|uniref:dihydrolipoyl dehydrogenase n=1 Tax=Athalassotoga sp. TaxID=2022597 RepID=UPI003CFCE9E1
MKTVDVVTIGAGGGAYPAGFRLAKSGMDVVMIDDKGVMSGNCLAEGCVPSKAIRESVNLYRISKKFDFWGLDGQVAFEYKKIIAHKDNVQKFRYAQHAEELKEALPHLQLVKGHARFLDDHTLEVKTEKEEEVYRAKRAIIVASGSETSILPINGADLCITSHDIFSMNPKLQTLPKTMTIIGGGYIALETATFFNELGTKVKLFKRSDRILSDEVDLRFSQTLRQFLDPNIEIVTGARVMEVERVQDGYRMSYVKDDKTESVTSDIVMMAVGRRSVIPEGADKIGIKTEHGRIIVNNAMQTNIPHIYAPGDVNGLSMLFHSAVRQSLVAANNIMAGNTPIDYMNFKTVPTTVFTFPEGAYVGILPDEAKSKGIKLVETSSPFKIDARAQIFGEMDGEIREFFDAETMKIVGAWVIGLDAGLLIGELARLVEGGFTVKEVAEFADQHPTTAEGIVKAARKLI